MKKRFVVAVDSTTTEQATAVTQFFKDHSLAWWHWLANLWLVSDARGVLTAKSIRDELKNALPGVNTVVIEINENGDTWAGFGPRNDDKNMFIWLRNNWKKT